MVDINVSHIHMHMDVADVEKVIDTCFSEQKIDKWNSGPNQPTK